jgi:FkbM family methyltransferase
MLRAVKDMAWRVLARGLGWAATAIRRRPSGGAPADWRAVHFSYSHFGEDLVVFHLLRDRLERGRGCYIDVGAFDPVLHSNTYLLYLHEWRGLNIDASAQRLSCFTAARPDDTNVVAAVSDAARDVLFLEYPTAGTSRVVAADDPYRENDLGEAPSAIIPSRTRTLSDILAEHCPAGGVDFLNVDCEGLDLAVLRGLDWSRWSPRVIAVEANTPEDRARIAAYLADKRYQLVSQHIVTLIFLHESAGDCVPPGMRPETSRAVGREHSACCPQSTRAAMAVHR